jgi:hypothetical protein
MNPTGLHALQDHLGGELPTFEGLILPYQWCSSRSRHVTASTRLDQPHQGCNRTGPGHILFDGQFLPLATEVE